MTYILNYSRVVHVDAACLVVPLSQSPHCQILTPQLLLGSTDLTGAWLVAAFSNSSNAESGRVTTIFVWHQYEYFE